MLIDTKNAIRIALQYLTCLGSCLVAIPAFAAPGDPLGMPIPIIDVLAERERPSVPEITVDQGGQVVVAWDRETFPGLVGVRRFAADLMPLAASSVVDPAAQPLSVGGAFPIAVATNPSGQTVVAYTARIDHPQGEQAVFARRYGRDGVALGDPVEVAVQIPIRNPSLLDLLPRREAGGNGRPAAVAINAAGEFVVSWVEEQFSASNLLAAFTHVYRSRVMARRYHADGTPAGEVEVLARRGPEPLAPVNGLHSVARVLAAPDDRFAVIYSSGRADGPVLGLRSPFSLQHVGIDGRPQGLARKLETGSDGALAISESDFHAAYTASGELLLTWVTETFGDDVDGSQAVYLRRYSAAGVPQGAPVQVAGRTQFHGCCSVRVVPMANGASAVLWAEYGNGRSVQARYFAADLSPLGELFVIAADTTQAGAVADLDGHLLVVHGFPETPPTQRQLYLRRFQGP